jgi:hypothetical protein
VAERSNLTPLDQSDDATDPLLEFAASAISSVFRTLLAEGKDTGEYVCLVQSTQRGHVQVAVHPVVDFAAAAEREAGQGLADWLREPCPSDHFRVVTNVGRKWLPYHLQANRNPEALTHDATELTAP